MKNKIILFLVASLIYGLLYFTILFFIENDFDGQSKLIQCVFFGVSMGLFEALARPVIFNKLKK